MTDQKAIELLKRGAEPMGNYERLKWKIEVQDYLKLLEQKRLDPIQHYQV